MSYTITKKPSNTNLTAPSASETGSGSTLTAEQLKRMEENRQKALQLKNSLNSANIINKINSESSKSLNSTNKINQISSSSSAIVSSTNQTTTKSPPKPTASSLPSSANDSLHGKCVPLGEDPENRFEVIIGYNKSLIELFKTVGSRKYNPDTKRWNFSLKNHDDLILRVKTELNNTVKLDPIDRGATLRNTMAKFILIDSNHFEVQAEFNPELQELFKGLKTKRYDPQLKRWSFELREHDELVNKIVSHKFTRGGVTVLQLPKMIREIFKEKFSAKTTQNKNDPEINLEHLRGRIDPNILKNLLPFQVESICFAIRQEGRLLLADDMGLGKTIQSLGIVSYYKNEWPMFIVVPSSVKFMWRESAKRWISTTLREICNLDEDDPVDDYIQVLENGRQPVDPECKIVISSYDLLAKNVEQIAQVHYQVIIADESHLLKNSKAQRTKSALRLIQNAKRVLLLSGTPALSRPSELFSQIQAINPTLFNNFHDFGIRYCDGKESNFGWDYSGYSNMKELRALLEEKIMIRREKKDVMTQLPSKIREMIILNPSLVELNTKSLKQASNKMEQNLKGVEKRGALLSYFQETSKAKVKAVCEYVIDLLESGKKFIVFAHHQHMLDELQNELEKNKYDFIRIDGSTNSEKRQFLVDKFQNSEKCLCALLSITAANSGITLTQATLVVFAELFWNPGILVQAEDRVYRIGQQNSVIIQYLCAKGTADDDIWPMVNSKLNVLSKAGLTKENLSDANTVNNFKDQEQTNFSIDLFKELCNEENDLLNELSESNEDNKPKVDKLKNDAINMEKSDGQLKIDQLLGAVDLAKYEGRPPVKKSKQN